MAVYRVEKTHDYTVMANHHLRDERLSLKAKGLLSMLLSLPDDWEISIRGLASIVTDGVGAVQTGINELIEAGYIVRRRQHADTAPCKPPRNPAVRPSATAASRPAIGGKKTCSRPAATAPEARPAGHRKKREVPPRKRRNLRYVPLPDYSSAPSGSATRIRPQYSQMMIFLP